MLIGFTLLFILFVIFGAYLIHCFYAEDILINKETIDKAIVELCHTLSEEELASLSEYKCSVDLGRWYISPDIVATEVAKDMCAYYGITPSNLYVGFSDECSSGAGVLHYVDNSYLIEIDVKLIQNHSKVIAILAHEVTHMFLFSKNISLPDTRANELLTDTCAAFLGFSSIMLDHYTIIRSTKVIERTEEYELRLHSESKLGYLDIDELAYVMAIRNFYFQSSSSLRKVIHDADAAMKDSPQMVIRGYHAFQKELKKAPHKSASFLQKRTFKKLKKRFLAGNRSQRKNSIFTFQNSDNPTLSFACPICKTPVTIPLIDGDSLQNCTHCKVHMPCLV